MPVGTANTKEPTACVVFGCAVVAAVVVVVAVLVESELMLFGFFFVSFVFFPSTLFLVPVLVLWPLVVRNWVSCRRTRGGVGVIDEALNLLVADGMCRANANVGPCRMNCTFVFSLSPCV